MVIQLNEENRNKSKDIDGVSLIRLLPGAISGNTGVENSKIATIMMGSSFLVSFMKANKNLFETKCVYHQSTSLNLEKVFSIFGLWNVTEPTELQKQEIKVECLRSKIEIKKYKYKDKETGAFSISVSDPDPLYSAELANKLVDYFFLEDAKSRRIALENELSFFSKKLVKPTLDKKRRVFPLINIS